MVYRTVELTSYDAYVLECSVPVTEQVVESAARWERMARFPFAVMLKVSYAERDFADRWCWSQFGPSDGRCEQSESEYRSCAKPVPHTHAGCWSSYWLGKTDYNFGFNEWYFESGTHRDRFLDNLGNLHWGEHYRHDRER